MSDILSQICTFELALDSRERCQSLEHALDSRILVLDGATGTAMQSANLSAKDFGGEELDGCNENLVFTRPDVVSMVHKTYLKAGADIIETNTFGGTPLVLDEYNLAHFAFIQNKIAAEIAREAAAQFSTPDRLRFVCGSIGPTTKAISVTGGITFAELIDHFQVQAAGLIAGGADYLLLETCQDTRNIKAGLIGIERAFVMAGGSIPVAVSATIETMGTMLAGQDAEAFATSLLERPLLYLGLNCATGPEQMAPHLRSLSELSRTRVALVPNAGLPDEDGLYQEGADVFTKVFERFIHEGWINLMGGCCGTTSAHVNALHTLSQRSKPRPIPGHHRAMVSGLEAVELTEANRPLLVGERTNVLGSRRFRRLIQEQKFESAAEIARSQVKNGAAIIDICLQDPDRDESADMENLLTEVIKRVKAPLMIDTTDAEVMELALTYCQGKSILNSINLEDGLKRFKEVLPLVKRYGAAVVVGTIDEVGMGVTVQRKLEIAERSHQILTKDFGINPEDIWWDALVFPCGTGDKNYLGSAGQTVAGVRAIKERFPLCKTILGVSNVSFGLPMSGREVLNSVFLYHCTKAGLDAAIVNTQRLARYAGISEEERALAEDLIFLTPGDKEAGDSAVAKFTAHFRAQDPKVRQGPARMDLPLGERLGQNIIEGNKEGLIDDLNLALADDTWPSPLHIVNGPLMTGMNTVGRLFNDNQLIVAEVLQSAEVMKTAVSHLEPHMDKMDSATRGTVLLATVRGDVHDIGKNLVDIILSNNGFRVVNLGIKVPNDQLIKGVREHNPDVIGLSGLLVKSAQQMVVAGKDLRDAGITTPMVVGGAALTRRFTHIKIADAYGSLCTYAKDAMSGLALIERMCNPDKRDQLTLDVGEMTAQDKRRDAEKRAAGPRRRSNRPTIRRDIKIPMPADLNRHIVDLDLQEVFEHMNPQMLYGKHLGLTGNVRKLKKAGDKRYLKLEAVVQELLKIAEDVMDLKAIYQFFPAQIIGQHLTLIDGATGKPACSFELPRQSGEGGLSLVDLVGSQDHVALFVATTGKRVRAVAERYKAEGEYLRSHTFAALALELAEAAAEVIHAKIRKEWGLVDSGEGATTAGRLKAKYQGKRYSFGYPACPDLEGQQELWQALRPEDIGVSLTEGDMMDPEASVSALVFHHPDAMYFSV